jgi:hypothetical protein
MILNFPSDTEQTISANGGWWMTATLRADGAVHDV